MLEQGEMKLTSESGALGSSDPQAGPDPIQPPFSTPGSLEAHTPPTPPCPLATRDHPLYRWRQKNRYYHHDLVKLHQFLIRPGQRVLEIGSGTGILLNSVAPSYGLGIDCDPTIVAQAQSAFPQLDFQIQDAHQLQIEGTFDIIILCNTIGSLHDIQAVLEQLRSLCTPTTRLILTFYNPIWEGILQFASAIGQRMPLPAQNWLSHHDVRNLLSLAHFEVIRSGKRMLIPRSIPLLAPLFNHCIAPLPGIQQLCLTEFIVARLQPRLDRDAKPEHQPSCSVVIPARNEAGNIRNCVENLPEMGCHTEIIFVEGNSTDPTWAEMQRVQAEFGQTRDIKILQQDGKGKGDAVRKGFAAATGDILIILDSDLTVQAEDMPKFFRTVTSGQCDFANGCRLVYPLDNSTMPSLNRWANRFFAGLLSYILGIQIKDSLCGTKVLRRSDYLTILANRNDFGDFDPFGDFDLLLGAVKHNLKIMDIPVRYYPRIYGQSNIQHVKEGFMLLKICWFAARKFRIGV